MLFYWNGFYSDEIPDNCHQIRRELYFFSHKNQEMVDFIFKLKIDSN